MAFGTFAPGYYAMTYDGTDCGLVEGVRRLRRRAKGQPIVADKFGDTTLDGIYRGGDVFLQVTFKEWIAKVREIIWPYDSDFGDIGQCGRLWSDLAKAIVLTAQSGSPAATAGPATITFNLALAAEENDIEIVLGNEQRDIPVLFRCLPYTISSGREAWFTVS